MKTKTPPTNRLGYLQMIARADAEEVVLQQQALEIQAKLQATWAEIDTLQARSATRIQSAETARQTVEALRADILRDNARSTITEGTLAAAGNEPSPKDLARYLQKANEEYTAILVRNQNDQAKDEARMRVLQADLTTYQQRQQENAALQEALVGASQHALSNLGEHDYQEAAASLNDLHANLAAKESEVTHASMALESFSQEALERLSQWPALQAQIKTLFLPHQDEVTHVLEAAITLFDALLTEGPRATIDLAVLRQINPFLGGLPELLALQEKDVWPVFTGRLEEARTVRERKTQLEQILELYRRRQREV